LERWDDNTHEVIELGVAIRTTIDKKLAQIRLAYLTPEASSKIIAGALDYFSAQVDDWAQGSSGLDIKNTFKIIPLEKGMSEIELGAFFNVSIPDDSGKQVQESLVNFESRLLESHNGWEEYNQLNNLYSNLKKIRQDIKEELQVIMLRRVVPGRCKYCPL
jgi:hypothetical protein